MSVTRRTWTDDSGNLSSGTIVNNAELQRIYDDIDARWSVVTITSVGTQNNLAISDADFVVFNNATDLTITGIAAPSSPAKPGKPLRFRCTGAGNVFFAHQSASSTAANRLINFATSGNTPCAGGSGTGSFTYDSVNSRWVLQTHEQGAWITPTFAAGDFTASGSMTWTVSSGNRVDMRYQLAGRRLSVAFFIQNTTVGGTPNTRLVISNAEWGGFSARSVASSDMRFPIQVIDNSARSIGLALVGALESVTSISITKADDTTNWSASTALTYAIGSLSFEVQ